MNFSIVSALCLIAVAAASVNANATPPNNSYGSRPASTANQALNRVHVQTPNRAPTQAPKPATKPIVAPVPSQNSGSIDPIDLEMICRVNILRARHSSRFGRCSLKHSIIQAQARRIAHDGLSDGSYMNRLVGYKTRWNPPAENVASHNESVERTYNQWFRSSGHYNNMIGDYTHTGCARAKGSDGVYYWTQLLSNTPSAPIVYPDCSGFSGL
ncbi:hypothetical protein BDF19DRAFT_438284 [Syncephalis fuscata]|nr:hypothetical protein BDF19DRAFT_438284 [Syncephalis fuscata]